MKETTSGIDAHRATDKNQTSPAGLVRGHSTIHSSAALSQSAPAENHRPVLNRGQSQIARFVGVATENDVDSSQWESRRLRFLSKRYKLKDSFISSHAGPCSTTPSTAGTPNVESQIQLQPLPLQHRTISTESRHRGEKKNSVAQVVFDHVASFVKRGTTSHPRSRVPLVSRPSFDIDADATAIGTETTGISTSSTRILDSDLLARRTIPGTIAEEQSSELLDEDVGSSSFGTRDDERDSVNQKTSVGSRSLIRQEQLLSESHDASFTPLLDEVVPIVPPRACLMALSPYGALSQTADEDHIPRYLRIRMGADLKNCDEEDLDAWSARPPIRIEHPDRRIRKVRRVCEHNDFLDEEDRDAGWYLRSSEEGHGARSDNDFPVPNYASPHPQSAYLFGDGRLNEPLPKQSLGTTEKVHPEVYKTSVDGQAVDSHATRKQWMDNVLNKLVAPEREKRMRGLGAISKFFNHHLGKKKVKELPPALREQMERGEDQRAFFTYWVSFVQIVVFALSVLMYGIGPLGVERIQQVKEVPDTALTFRQVTYFEPPSIWIGPRFADLIKLGAKYSPCMRRERGLWKEIETQQMEENKTACCIFNDGSGCYQTSKSYCPRSLGKWAKWQIQQGNHSGVSHPAYSNRQAGSVCGEDPNFCDYPRPSFHAPWPDDLTKWPICTKPRLRGAIPEHMTCKLSGRPCCIALQGRCRITTEEYCTFVRGYWHANATLCSQVDCLSDVCGMLPFFNSHHPDQIYRLFISLFVHAGIFHLILTLFVQFWLMLDLEKLIGWKRMALVYIASGVGGNLASAVFVPYNPEVGPSGSQFGLIAAFIVDVVHHRFVLEDWKKALSYHLMLVVVLLIIGLAPWVDNWAHLFGFIFGLFVTATVFPYLDFSEAPKDSGNSSVHCVGRRHRRTMIVALSFVSGVSLFLILLFLFLFNVQIDCPYCSYFNCIPLPFVAYHLCENEGHTLHQWLPI